MMASTDSTIELYVNFSLLRIDVVIHRFKKASIRHSTISTTSIAGCHEYYNFCSI